MFCICATMAKKKMFSSRMLSLPLEKFVCEMVDKQTLACGKNSLILFFNFDVFSQDGPN